MSRIAGQRYKSLARPGVKNTGEAPQGKRLDKARAVADATNSFADRGSNFRMRLQSRNENHRAAVAITFAKLMSFSGCQIFGVFRMFVGRTKGSATKVRYFQ